MDPKACEESAKDALDFKCGKILHAVDKSIACPTPEKKTEPLHVKSKVAEIQLPEKYRTIADLFSHMSCSLRLLHLRKKSPTFQNICSQVEVLAKRKISYAHLAQMKYILSEGIHIDKVLVHDKKSLCMKPDMKITLVYEVVEEHSEQSADMALRQYFSSRLTDFFNMHPEMCKIFCPNSNLREIQNLFGCVLLGKFESMVDPKEFVKSIIFGFIVDKATDIPEAILPEPFSRRTCSLICEDFVVISSTALSSTSNQIELLPEKFHLYPSFSRHFSVKIDADQTEKVQCVSSTKPHLSSYASDFIDNQESESTWQKGFAPLSDHVTNLNTERGQQKESFSICFQPRVINTPVNVIGHSANCSSSESPDMKVVSSADSLMTETPAQSAPRRLLPVFYVKLQDMTAQKSTSCFKPAKRVLDFSLMEVNDDLDNRMDMLESSRGPHEVDRIPEPIRGFSEDCNSLGSVALPQEVEESLGYSFEKTNQNRAGLDAWHKNLSSLVDLVNAIDSIFRSVKRTPITKEELLQKIIMNNLDFVQIGEVEEQIEILEKLVPDWICKKLVSSGDIMYCVKKVSDLDSVRSRLSSNVTVGG